MSEKTDSAMARRRRLRVLLGEIACLVVLAVLVAIAFSDVLGPDRGLFFRDHSLVFRPRWRFVSDRFHAGAWPAYDAYNSTGVPFENLLNATYVPTSLLFFAGDFDLVYDLHVALVVFVLGAGTFGFARALGADRLEAQLTAAAAMLVGPVLSFENLLVALQGLAYAPWVYWAAHTLIQRPSVRSCALLALALGFHLQGIMPEVLALDFAVFVALLAHVRPRPTLRLHASLAAAGFLGLCIASIELMPALEALAGTKRGAGFDYAVASMWSLSPAQLFDLWIPSLWYPPESPMIQIPSIVGSDRGYPYLTSLYFGSILSLVAIAFVPREGRKRALVLLAAALLGIAVAMGPRTPLHPFLASLPGFRSGRFPVKYLLFTTTALIALVPRGWRAFLRRPWLLAAAAGIQCLLLLALFPVLESGELRDFLASALRDDAGTRFVGVPFSAYPGILVEAMEKRLHHACAFSALTAAAAVLLAMVRRHARGERPAQVLAFGAIACDLAFAARFSVVGASGRDAAPPDRVLTMIASPYERVVQVAADAPEGVVVHREGHTYFEDKVRSDRLRGFLPDRPIRYLYDTDIDAESNPIHVAAYRRLRSLDGDARLRMIARLGGAWILSSRPWLGAADSTPFEVPGEAAEYVNQVPDPRPYVEIHPRWRRLPIESAVDAMSELGDEALVFGDDAPSDVRTSTACAEGPRAAATKTWSPGSVGFETESPCRTVAVIREVSMPGWTAMVDGTGRPIFQTEAGFLGVEIPPGHHSVEARYVRKLDRWRTLSGVNLGIALLLLAVPRFSKRKDAGG
jgi:hypothetical protein